MTSRGKETSKESRDDTLPTTSSAEPQRFDTSSLSDELCRDAGAIKWPRAQEMGELGQMAELSIVLDYY